jgi:TldD protein
VPTRKTQVIEKGRLTSYLYDRLCARQAGASPTGNGRRQSFRHVPIPRMTTTYIGPGDSTPDAVIAATPRGFYAKSLAGGQVEPASGNFVFGVAEGYLIEDGRVTTPLRGATLVGNGIDILMKIDMIADDFEVKSGICGKDGQGVPVGTGQATLRISEMTVGGTG